MIVSRSYIKEGFGFQVGQDFARASTDIPILLAPTEYAKPGHIVGYIDGNPNSKLGFLRGYPGHEGTPRVRVHVRKDGIGERP